MTAISVPVAIHYLGIERYGILAALTSSAIFFTFADLGIGNGLVNSIAGAYGKNDHEAARRAVSNASILMIAAMCVFGAIFWACYPFIDWQALLNVHTDVAVREAGPAVAAVFFCFLFNLPVSVVQKVHLGYQEGYWINAWQTGASLIGLGAFLLLVHANYGIPVLAGAVSGAPILTGIGNSIVQFCWKRPWLAPRVHDFNVHIAQRLLSSGAAFLTYGVFQAIGFYSDALILAVTKGPTLVAEYVVVQKLWQLAFAVAFLNPPIWSAYSEALARGDRGWVSRSFCRFVPISVGSVLFISVILVIFGRAILGMWVGPNFRPSFLVLTLFGMVAVTNVFVQSVSTLLNTEAVLRKHNVIFCSATLIAVALKVPLALWFGIPGVLTATVIGYGCAYVAPSLRLVRQALQAQATDLTAERAFATPGAL